MIVTTGKFIHIDLLREFTLSRNSEHPFAVEVKRDGVVLVLPGNLEEAQRFVVAYLRIVNEDVEYRKMESE